ncbi:MAG: zinc ribbon domain-containing protein [Trueperaceae bacterium]|nr:zinc ribbon domain-containing protein [Trueperaceae bacterium]
MKKNLSYLLCPKCQRALPSSSKERYCPNDGLKMLEACPHCDTAITSPYSRFCTNCGESLLETMVSQAAEYLPSRDVSDEISGKKGFV